MRKNWQTATTFSKLSLWFHVENRVMWCIVYPNAILKRTIARATRSVSCSFYFVKRNTVGTKRIRKGKRTSGIIREPEAEGRERHFDVKFDKTTMKERRKRKWIFSRSQLSSIARGNVTREKKQNKILTRKKKTKIFTNMMRKRKKK